VVSRAQSLTVSGADVRNIAPWNVPQSLIPWTLLVLEYHGKRLGRSDWHMNISFKRGAVTVTITVLVLVSSLFPFVGVGATLEDISPQFATNIPIVWQASTNHLPAHFWTYKRLPHIFSDAAISNGVVLASFEKKGFPRPSTNEFVIWADHPDMEPKPPYFSIFPKYGQMSFTLGDRAPNPSGVW
jgi:hypothetical protein